jgi:hypothetical protein
MMVIVFLSFHHSLEEIRKHPVDFFGHVDIPFPRSTKAYYQAFFWVLIDLIVELLVLIIKPFDSQTES